MFLNSFVLLQTRDWFLLVRTETEFRSASSAFSYYVLQSSASLSLLLKPVLTRELILPCNLPILNEDPPLSTLNMVEVFSLSLSFISHTTTNTNMAQYSNYVVSCLDLTWSQPKPSQFGKYMKYSGSIDMLSREGISTLFSFHFIVHTRSIIGSQGVTECAYLMRHWAYIRIHPGRSANKSQGTHTLSLWAIQRL